MKLRFVGILSLALITSLSAALLAQDEDRRRGRGRGGFGQRGGPGGFRGGPGMMGGRNNGALTLLSVLRIEGVAEGVGFAEAGMSALDGLREEMREVFRAEPSEREAKLEEMDKKARAILDEVLTPEGQGKLMGVALRSNGIGMITNDLIAEKIGLSEDDKEKVQEAMRDGGEEMRETMREVFAGGRPDPSQREEMMEKVREMMEQSREKMEKGVLAVLTKEQQAAVDQLKESAADIELPERGRRGFGRGRGPGGRRGPGGPGRGRPGRGGDN